MKKVLLAAAFVAAMLCTGCDCTILSTPLVGSADMMKDDRLVGNWSSPDSPESIRWVIRGAGNRYSMWESLASFQKNEPPKELALTRIGAATFLQIADDCANYGFHEHSGQRCFEVHVADIGDQAITYWSLDTQRLMRDSTAGLLNIDHVIRTNVTKSGDDYTRDTTFVLNGTTEVLRGFFGWYARDTSIWKDSTVLKRHS